jgi:hypothetical protein
VSQKFLHDDDHIVDPIQPRGWEVMTQGVDYDVCGRDTKSEVGQDAAGDIRDSVQSKAED